MLRFCFSLGERLGVVDPRQLHLRMDCELMALWLAHFNLREHAAGPSHQQKTEPTIIDHDDVDRQVSVCERLLL